MIFQLYQTLTDYTNSTGSADLATTFCYDASIVHGFMSIVILFPLFFIVLLATYFGVKATTGRGDFLASFTAASFITLIAAIILSLVNCMGTNIPLLDSTTLVVVLAIFVVSALLLWLTRD